MKMSLKTEIEKLNKKIDLQFDAINARLKTNTEFVRAFFREHPEAVIPTGRRVTEDEPSSY
jgi:hypothetical protein